MNHNKAGVNTSTIIDPMKERKKQGIKAVKSNCGNCIYYNKKKCNFNKNTTGRTKCIKYTTAHSHGSENKVERVINKSSFRKMSEFFEYPITQDMFTKNFFKIGKGYIARLYKSQPYTIVLRNRKTKREQYFEIIDVTDETKKEKK